MSFPFFRPNFRFTFSFTAFHKSSKDPSKRSIYEKPSRYLFILYVSRMEAIAREISQPNPIKIEAIHAHLVESSSRKTVKLRGLWVTSARIAPRNRLTTKIAGGEREVSFHEGTKANVNPITRFPCNRSASSVNPEGESSCCK